MNTKTTKVENIHTGEMVEIPTAHRTSANYMSVNADRKDLVQRIKDCWDNLDSQPLGKATAFHIGNEANADEAKAVVNIIGNDGEPRYERSSMNPDAMQMAHNYWFPLLQKARFEWLRVCKSGADAEARDSRARDEEIVGRTVIMIDMQWSPDADPTVYEIHMRRHDEKKWGAPRVEFIYEVPEGYDIESRKAQYVNINQAQYALYLHDRQAKDDKGVAALEAGETLEMANRNENVAKPEMG